MRITPIHSDDVANHIDTSNAVKPETDCRPSTHFSHSYKDTYQCQLQLMSITIDQRKQEEQEDFTQSKVS